MCRKSHLFELIESLVACHSPSGMEAAVDALLIEKFRQSGIIASLDPSGNLVARIAGSGAGRLIITAHKDEIGAVVIAIGQDGRLKLSPLGGSFPWVYGEGIVDVLGDERTVQGVLSFGSRHVSHASPQFEHRQEKAPLKWADSWVETKISRFDLESAGVRIGTRVVVGLHRKSPFRLGEDHVASYTLDNKASLAILIELAGRIKNPPSEICLVATTKEEIGASGALYFTHREHADAMIALEIAPLAIEYDIMDSAQPVIYSQDGFGLYHDQLNAVIIEAARTAGIRLQYSAVNGFGSDASISTKAGHVPRGACLAFPTENTHGYEIARLSAIENCISTLEAVCKHDFAWPH